MRLTGYVIVRGLDAGIEVFEGFRPTGTMSRVNLLKPAWGKPFLGRGIERFALYKSHIEAEEARQHPELATAYVEPLWIGESKADPRGKFEEVNEKLGKDPYTEHYGSISEVFDNNMSELTELLDTGSVTIELPFGKYVLTLNVKEE